MKDNTPKHNYLLLTLLYLLGLLAAGFTSWSVNEWMTFILR